MTTTHENPIIQAIDESTLRDIRVCLDWPGDEIDFFEHLGSCCDDEYDYAYENDGTLDLWSTNGEWRLSVTLLRKPTNQGAKQPH